MNNIFIVMGYTIKENIRKKSFIISNIIMFAIIILLFNVPNIMNLMNGDKESKTPDQVVEQTKNKVILVDTENLLEGENIISDTMEFIKDNNMSVDMIKEKIQSGEIHSAVILKRVETGIGYDYLVKEKGIFTMDATSAISDLIKTSLINKEMKQLNASEEMLAFVNSSIIPNVQQVVGGEAKNDFGIAMASSFILFFAIYFFGYSVSVSVSSEKTSRVMETLVTSTNPRSIIIGKTLGMGIVGLLDMLSLILVAVLSYMIFLPKEMNFISQMIDFSTFNITSFAIILIYFILGYIVFAFLNAVTGATVNKVEDIQAANMPISIVSILSFYLAYFTAMMPNSGASKFASIFPFSSAFSMPGRILAGGVTGGEIALSIILLILTACILAFISIKVYSAAILHYGERLKFSDIPKLLKKD